jgi:methionine synthase I (cobalamin-dependent)
MSRLSPWLAQAPVIVDGAWGTELQRRGLEPGACADLWNIDRPADVLAVAQSYVDAGSRVILTNTFRANRIAITADIPRINRAGVELSRQAAGERAAVFASMGPSGKVIAVDGIAPEAVVECFREQALACAGAGADALLLETFSDPEEARLALRGAKAAGVPVLLSFAFDSGKNKDRTMMGLNPEQAAALALEEGADAIGANCGVGPDVAIGICRRLHAAAPALPVWIKPNAGLPVLEGGCAVYATSPEVFAEALPALVEAGACFVGGCCGSNPDFVRALVQRARSCAAC